MSRKRTASIQQLVGHIPDSVVYIDHSNELPYYKPGQGVILFADISGFTSLTEKYTLNAKGGADQLTKTLNGYMGAIVDTILSGDGDILKYAGDAILSIWPAKSRGDLPGTVARAIKIALSIQSRYGEWNTDVGVKLKVKIGIAAGEYCITYVGNDEFRHYATTGEAVVDVNGAEKFCESGFVVCSPYAWSMSEKSAYTHEYMSDGKHVRVIEQLQAVQSNYDLSMSRSLTSALKEIVEKKIQDDVKPFMVDIDLPQTEGDISIIAKAQKKRKNSIVGNESRYRKAILEDKNDKLRDKLKLYIIRPVLKKIEDDQPLEYLSEMRQVTILFINLVIEENMEMGKQAKVLQRTFDIIYGTCMNVNGCLNKVFVFDKGLTFLSIFGLPGFKHENDTQHALQSADTILKQSNQVEGCSETSIGVTTGATFCGVVGHKHRQEYTVIGRKVNMAARLMMYYPGKVTCDTDSFHHSKLPNNQFVDLEARQMKGLVNVGQIREFIGGGEAGHGHGNKIKRFSYPMLGRLSEMQQTKTLISKKYNGDLTSDMTKEILVIEGEAGTGKTRLLGNQIVYADEQGFAVIPITCQMGNTRTPYYVVRYLLQSLLHLDPQQSHQERETQLSNLFGEFSPEVKDSLYLLNTILNLKFPKSDTSTFPNTDEGLQALVQKIVATASAEIGFILFAIDDSHYMDKESWELARALGHYQFSLTILTKRPCKGMNGTLCGCCRKRLPEDNIELIRLEGLESNKLAALACQMLGVTKIPKPLEMILIKKSHGVPSWCEQLLCEMLSDEVVQVVPQDDRIEDMSIPAVSDLTQKRFSDMEVDEKAKAQPVIKMCILNPDSKVDINSISAPESMKALILARIDHMQATDQMCVKSASVIGMEFHRVMLEAITPAKSPARVRMAVRRLTVNGVFECASPRPEGEEEAVTAVSGSIKCFCPTPDGKKKTTCSLLACAFMRFVSSLMQETAYEIFLEVQRREMHTKSAEYLETKAHKCEACGGGEFKSAQPRTEEKSLGVERNPRRLSRLRKLSSITSEPDDTQSRKGSTISESGNEVIPEGLPTWTQDVMQDLPERNSLTVDPATRRASIREFLGIQTGHFALEGNEGCSIIEDDPDQDFLEGVDLRSCTCNKILQQVFPELIRHYRAAGNVKKTLQFLYEAAAASMETKENVEVMTNLDEIARIIKVQKAGDNPFEGEVNEFLKHEVTLEERVRIAKLKGQAFLQLGHNKKGLLQFTRALKMMGYHQPDGSMSVVIGTMKEGFRQFIHRTFPERYMEAHVNSSPMTVEKIRCLLDTYQIHSDRREMRESLFVALQQINLAESECNDIHQLIQSYTCMIECCILLNRLKRCTTYKNVAITRINDSVDELTTEDMKAVAALHSSILRAHLARGELIDACEAGYNVDRITERLHDTNAEIQILPLLVQTLIMLDRITNCMEVLEQLQFLADEMYDGVALGWYYVSVMDLLLTTGNKIVSVARCMQFAKEFFDDNVNNGELELKFTLASSLCLWCTRVADMETADQWYTLAEKNMPNYYDTYFTVSSYAKLLECQLLRLSQYMSQSTETELQRWGDHCWRMLNNFTTMTKRLRIFIPRMFQLRAFCLAVLRRKAEAKFALEGCVVASNAQYNSQEAQWAKHNLQIWYKKVDRVQDDFWLQHWGCSQLEQDDDDIDGVTASGTNIKFTLPLPEWFVFDDEVSIKSQ